MTALQAAHGQPPAPGAADGRMLVVIPAYGLVHLTRDAVADALREPDHALVLVIDNEGDYRAVAGETIVRPGRNLGWLRASNAGMQAALDAGATGAVLLNNDTRLSDGFFAGLAQAHEARRDAVLAPLYDDIVPEQHYDLTDGLASFVPRPVEVSAARIDGTCVLVPRHVMLAIGLLDERRFGRHGWGGIDDYFLRARNAGFDVAVTYRSFVQHLGGGSAGRTTRYAYFAQAEMIVGMTRKYGTHWRDNFEPGQYGEAQSHELVSALARSAQERVGLGKVEWHKLLKRPHHS